MIDVFILIKIKKMSVSKSENWISNNNIKIITFIKWKIKMDMTSYPLKLTARIENKVPLYNFEKLLGEVRGCDDEDSRSPQFILYFQNYYVLYNLIKDDKSLFNKFIEKCKLLETNNGSSENKIQYIIFFEYEKYDFNLDRTDSKTEIPLYYFETRLNELSICLDSSIQTEDYQFKLFFQNYYVLYKLIEDDNILFNKFIETCKKLDGLNRFSEIIYYFKYSNDDYNGDNYGNVDHINKIKGLIDKLVSKELNIDMMKECGSTLLMPVSCYIDRNMVNLLLDYGANTNIVDRTEETAIFNSIGATEITQLLLDHGANVNEINQTGQTPLINACSDEKTIKILLKYGATTGNKNGEGENALICAAEMGEDGVIELLLNAGTNDITIDNNGEIALHKSMNKYNKNTINGRHYENDIYNCHVIDQLLNVIEERVFNNK